MAHPNQQPQLQQPVPGLNQQHATTHMQPQAKYPYAAAYPSQYAQQQQVDPRRQLKDEFPHDKESDE
jgi:phage tail sheath gpL-like